MSKQNTMRAAVIDRLGEADELHLAETARPLRISDEVLVRVVAAGVNPIDVKTRAGRGTSAAIESFPTVLGLDFAGVVEQVPYAAHPLQPGDAVFGMGRYPRGGGSYAEYIAVSSMSVLSKPAALSFAEAAALPVAALTAWGMVVELGKAHQGQRVLVHAGAGGVGHFAVQFARFFGAHVTATGSAGNAEFLRGLGAHEVIDYRSERFEERVRDIDVVIDLIGNVHADTGTRSLDVLRPGGLLVNAPTGSWPSMAADAAARGIRATGYNIAPDARTLGVIGRLIEQGQVRPHIERVFPLAEAAEAHRLQETGHVRGKLVLRVDETLE
ncbi:NADP-dependent oxidoreductase [Microterricola viridarii]|uniref:NADPH:quinone reductase n=1 Tax=Microterricola viridarii TaxID=412690 RepID=A0A1H1ZLI7_9MICO|nr:NADP-dependent oxidoreductase [Microterricola viridarii]SDT34530.1 NADPH:quinone reductase [Microterricola viridarii]